MLGDDNASNWTIEGGNIKRSTALPTDDAEESVVILGYEDEAPNAQTDTMTEVATESDQTLPAHLHCFKEACRFYKEKTGHCQFDLMFSMLDTQAKSIKWDDDSAQQTSKQLSKDIDKIWKFQTKSAEELIKSFGEYERNQEKSVDILKQDLGKSLDTLATKVDKSSANDLKKNLTALKKKIDEREEGLEDLSSTMSELVLNLHEPTMISEDWSRNPSNRGYEISSPRMYQVRLPSCGNR
jgi:hypothetical protein